MSNYQSHEKCTACSESRFQRCYHHVKSRGSGGGDEKENLMSLCFKCHTEVHKIGLSKFAEKWDMVKDWLLNNKWELCEIRKKWVRV